MNKRARSVMWLGVALAVVAVAVAAALTVDGLRNLGADDGGGLRKGDAGTKCVGTRPVSSLPDGRGVTAALRLVMRIDQVAPRRHPDVFTGLAVDEDDQAADVWRIPSDAFDAEICGLAVRGTTVRLHDTDVNRKTLDALSDRVVADTKRWDGTFAMREVGVDERGFVRVGVDDPDTATPLIEKAYGEENARYIRVVHEEPAHDDVGGTPV
ncbi:hypothetical protein [Streptomyces brasiliensis]|uniref:Uncharacterized protein n=1 Tax=Streptomyces brasiliensis TaxID=1954 RepID=A0A917P2P7_9ACTN|nr:hypothetical protein [Streptomyces brasiliensis]GGJ57212.1 hypothetical protein GCM10010121_079840 [Streptomyces brasiliensis]